jgi:hypothetical protein
MNSSSKRLRRAAGSASLAGCFSLLCLIATAGCASDPPTQVPNGPDAAGECLFNEDSRLVFTEVERADDLSNVLCPELTPDTLNGQVDAASGEACDVTPTAGCSADVQCQFLGTFNVTGSVTEVGDVLEGRFEVTTPVMCVYFVTATVAE